MLLKPLLNTISYASSGAYWVGENLFGIPLIQMGQTVQATASGSALLEGASTVFNYQPESFEGKIAKYAIENTLTTAIFATAIGSVAAGGLVVASPWVIGSSVVVSTGLFALENFGFLGRETSDYARAYLQYKTAGVALEAVTKTADYGMSFIRDDWDQNYITGYKNILLSADQLYGVASGKGSYLGKYMKIATEYLNTQLYDFVVNNWYVNAAFDLYAAYKLIGLEGLFAGGLKDGLDTGHRENIRQQLLEDIRQVNPEGRNFDEPQRILDKEVQHEMNRGDLLEDIQQVNPENRNFAEPQRILGKEVQHEMNRANVLENIQQVNPEGRNFDEPQRILDKEVQYEMNRANVLESIQAENYQLNKGTKTHITDYAHSAHQARMKFYDELGEHFDKNSQVVSTISSGNHKFVHTNVQTKVVDYAHSAHQEKMKMYDSIGKNAGVLSNINENIQQELDHMQAPVVKNYGLEEYQKSVNQFLLEDNIEFASLKHSLNYVNEMTQLNQQMAFFNPEQCFINSDTHNSLLDYNTELQYHGGDISAMNNAHTVELVGADGGFNSLFSIAQQMFSGLLG